MSVDKFARDALLQLKTTVAGIFTSSAYRPTPEAGSDLPNGAYYTSVDATDGLQYRYQRTAGGVGYTRGRLVYSKADVGLPNADNTRDADKPVSTQQAAAIADAKSNPSLSQANVTAASESSVVFPDGVLRASVGLTILDTSPEVAIEAACARVGNRGVVTVYATSVIRILRTIFIPAGVSVCWRNARITPAAGAQIGSFLNGFMIATNVDSAGAAVFAYGGDAAIISDLHLYNEPFGGTTQLPGLRGIYSSSRHSIVNLRSEALWQTYFKPEGFGYAGYIDQVELRNISVGNPRSADFALSYNGLGDNIIVDNISTFLDKEYNNLVYVKNCRGGRVSRILGAGVLRLENCDSIEVTGHHIEQGYIELINTFANIHTIHIWKNKNFQPVAPIVIRTGGQFLQGGPVKISALTIYYTATGTGSGLPDAYGADAIDVAIEDGISVNIDSSARRFGGGAVNSASPILVGTPALSGTPPVATANVAWSDRRHILALGASLRGGASIQAPWVPSQRVNNNAALTAVSIVSAPWRLPSGTYRYRAQILFGPPDRLVGQRSEVLTATPVNGDAGAVAFNGLSTGFSLCFIRIWRAGPSDANGTYSYFVDTANLAGAPIDTGYYLATGEAWKPTTGGTSPGLSTGPAFCNGNFNNIALDDPDGGSKVTCHAAADNSAPPVFVTAGSWGRGDRVIETIATVGRPKAVVNTGSGFTRAFVSEGNL